MPENKNNIVDGLLRQVVKPVRKVKVTAEDLIRESGYVRTD